MNNNNESNLYLLAYMYALQQQPGLGLKILGSAMNSQKNSQCQPHV